MSQGEVWAGLRKARTLATGFVSRAAAAPATPLKRVHDTFHKALRDADAAPLGQPLPSGLPGQTTIIRVSANSMHLQSRISPCSGRESRGAYCMARHPMALGG